MDLTQTEMKVAEYVTRGYSEKEIASEMFISPKTVHNHTYNIRKKWNARSAVDLARTFILNLENPKQYFAAIVALVIQFHIMINCETMELRRPVRTSARIVRVKSGRKNKD
ncbi:response regulator transcription factor [Xanthomarina gelatinilytica]|uniref:response regulator transcription factor n=1 Tax=Xanthomarina gelatinilytica TaxID=1137281 RepID=UPI003AA92BBD